MITIDSDILRSMTSVAGTAVDDITSGKDKLYNVTTHDDWNCVERDYINDGIMNMKKKIDILQGKTSYFLELIKQSADKFDSVDCETSRFFQDTNGSIGDSFAIQSSISNNTALSASQEVQELLLSKGADYHWTGYILSSTQPIKICNYSDLDFGKISGGN